MELTVIICTYNPRREVIDQTLAALRAQTLPLAQWELLIIDNASTNGVPAALDLSWHPHARRVLEPTLGIAAARNRAFVEVLRGDSRVLLFVDDDTLLAPEYLVTGLALAAQDPRLGCWGGQLLPRYEVNPPDWFPPFEKYLAIFPLDHDLIADSFNGNYDYLPPTAGLFLQRRLAEHYLPLSVAHPLRLMLGAKGDILLRGEDTDLALAAYDCGLRTGRFQALRLVHLIPKDRITLEYLERLLEGIRAGVLIIDYLRGRGLPPKPGLRLRLERRWQVLRLPERQSRFMAAELRGEKKARELIAAAPPALSNKAP
jgi:glycosyltransferase involved in cell wall biosynthesis